MLVYFFLIVAFVLLLGVMVSHVLHLMKLLKEEEGDFHNANMDEFLSKYEVTVLEQSNIRSIATFRWVLILPVMICVFILIFVLLGLVAGWSIGIPSDQTHLTLWFAIAGILLAVTWVLTASIIAPNYKLQTAWVAFTVGALFLVFVILDSGGLVGQNYVWSVGYLSAIASGFLTAVGIHLYIKLSR